MSRSAGTFIGIALLLAAELAGAHGGGDAMHERVAACTACHASKGIQLDGGYVPRIHGKPAGYLYNQLVNYQDHRRRNTAMNHMVAHLSHRYLHEIAIYFADQNPPYPPAAPAPRVRLATRGKQLVREGNPNADIPACQACHGERLTGVEPNTPGLVGLPRHYIMAQLGAWRVGSRHAAAPDCMARIASRLDGNDIEAVASWLAARAVPADSRPAGEPIAEPPLECGSVPAPGA